MKNLLSVISISFISLFATNVFAQVSIGMVTDVGGIHDQSFNQSAWEGLKRAEEELDAKIAYKESFQDADYRPNIETFMDTGSDLIIGVGFTMGDSVLEMARNNPTQKLAIIDYTYGDETPRNLTGVLFKEQEGSFLVGYIAGKMTNTNKIGFVGGIDIPVVWRFHYGFMAGVKHANPEAEVIVQYANSFVDTALGKTIANGMYQNGVDIVFHAAGGVGEGVIESAKENKKWAIGVDRDQNYLAPDNVITSMIKRVDTATYTLSKEIAEDTFRGRRTLVLGLKENGVGISPNSEKHVPKDILAQVDTISDHIIKGDITPPGTKEEFESFKTISVE